MPGHRAQSQILPRRLRTVASHQLSRIANLCNSRCSHPPILSVDPAAPNSRNYALAISHLPFHRGI